MFSTASRTRSAASHRVETLDAAIERLRALVDTALDDLVRSSRSENDPLTPAVAAALCSPGKRLRPVLSLMVAEVFGGDSSRLVSCTCAVELVHAASLVLDDLPCMDDAATRRGQPTLHRRFGESTAILAAFSLLAQALSLLPQALAAADVPPAHRTSLARRLTEVVVAMCHGQALDLALPGTPADLALLEGIHARKTGALFELAAEVGAVSAGGRGERLAAVLAYARNLGLAFQVSDDLLDVAGDSSKLGKPTGRDTALGRTTFVSVFGEGGARTIRDELVNAAVAALAPLVPRGSRLAELAEYVRLRAA